MDVYRNEIPASKNVSDYAFYMTFFPHLVAGPIVRAKDFLPQIVDPQPINAALYKESLLRIMSGLLKKLFIADYIGKYVDIVHELPQNFSGAENLLAMYGYSFQIYFDFSGYSDIAIGIALMLGYRLKENFENPYTSTNVTVFWRKWHISLSSWLKDYIYIPLGGNRKGEFNTYLFLLITMLVGGFWHGADWRFVFWGLAHGLALAFHKAWKQLFPRENNSHWSRIASTAITFHFVAFCWIFFRAPSSDIAFQVLDRIGNHFDTALIMDVLYGYRKVFLVILLGYVLHLLPDDWTIRLQEKVTNISIFILAPIIAIFVILVYQAISGAIQPFIYFQF
jgi:D-alanyl-lipoteichoic acid acyltransferase DltB (MBOAT superfamily)